MKKGSLGSSLIEFLVYCTAASLLIVFLLETLSLFHHEHNQQAAYGNDLVSAYIGLDLLRREVSQAPAAVKSWFGQGPQEIIWQVSPDRCRCYRIEHHNMVRIDGIYDPRRNQWRDKITSLVIARVSRGEFHVRVTDGAVDSVALSVTIATKKGEKSLQEIVALRNRSLG